MFVYAGKITAPAVQSTMEEDGGEVSDEGSAAAERCRNGKCVVAIDAVSIQK